MILYNVTFDLKDTKEILEPKIPYTAGDYEDKTIKRVCLADTPAHCMLSISPEFRNIAVGSQFLLKEFEITDYDNLLTPEYLYNMDLVADALEYREHWYLNSIQCRSVRKCKILDFYSEICLNWTCIGITDCRNIIKKYLGVNELPFKGRTSRELYSNLCKWDTEFKYIDDIWDDLALLPWAQGRTLNLTFKEIK